MTAVIIKQHMVVAQVVLYPALADIKFNSFALTAVSDGQVTFTMPVTPVSMVLLAIQGVVQSPDNGDYSFVGNVLTIPSGVDAGDLIAGVYV